ncbi:hypothetical protein [Moorena sp. SIO1F2]|nr:hypothetical protein [Moorena sp. SIO1F2]
MPIPPRYPFYSYRSLPIPHSPFPTPDSRLPTPYSLRIYNNR